MYITIKTLWKKYKNKSLITRLTGHDWKTIAKVIKEVEAGKEYPTKRPHPRILDSLKKQIIEWIKEWLTKVRIFEKLQKQDLKAGYSTVKDYITQIKIREKIFVRIHTLPGEEAQVDFSYLR